MLRQILDRIAAMVQDALVAVDEGDARFAAAGGREARVVGEIVRVLVQGPDVDDLGPRRAAQYRKLDRFPGRFIGQLDGAGVGAAAFRGHLVHSFPQLDCVWARRKADKVYRARRARRVGRNLAQTLMLRLG